MLLSGDSDLAFDLRELNQGNHTKYDEFWEGIHQVLQRDFPPAAEERRHGNDLYLPVAISLQDLKRKVLEVIQILGFIFFIFRWGTFLPKMSDFEKNCPFLAFRWETVGGRSHFFENPHKIMRTLQGTMKFSLTSGEL